MRDTTIENKTFLGPFVGEHSLNVVHNQSMIFREGSIGLYYLPSSEREVQRKDQLKGTTSKVDRKKADLVTDLKQKSLLAVGSKCTLIEQCKANDIPFFNVEDKKQGWKGKPKGMLQILYKRGFVDPKKFDKFYIVDRKKDEFGNEIECTSLKKLMLSLPDFVNEEAMHQYHVCQCGIIVDRTPKCHPELTVEVINRLKPT